MPIKRGPNGVLPNHRIGHKKMDMTKKLRNHLINYLRVTGVYVGVLSGLAEGRILTSLVSNSDPFEKLQMAATIIYALITTWFCWRFYTGVVRDGDFLD